MKSPDDNKTPDLVTALRRGRGRPPVGGVAQTPAERQKARRDRLAASGERPLTVTLPADLLAALDKFVEFKDLSKSEVVERILRDRLLRKR